jgi:hypothetical protein
MSLQRRKDKAYKEDCFHLVFWGAVGSVSMSTAFFMHYHRQVAR